MKTFLHLSSLRTILVMLTLNFIVVARSYALSPIAAGTTIHVDQSYSVGTLDATHYHDIASVIWDLNGSGGTRPDGAAAAYSGGVSGTGTVNIDVSPVTTTGTETFTSLTAGKITKGGNFLCNIDFKVATGHTYTITGGTGTGNIDYIIALVGVSFITFDGINVQDNPANTTEATQMEYGYALLKVATGNSMACSHNVIQNCTITLQPAYSPAPPSGSNIASVGILCAGYFINGAGLSSATPANSTLSVNTNNLFQNNTINSASIGIAEYGGSASLSGTNLSGTVSVTSGNTSVTGSSTLFTTQLIPGMYLYSNSGNTSTFIGQIASIQSNTGLTLKANAPTTVSGGTGYPVGGTITTTAGSLTVTGTNTHFLTDVSPGFGIFTNATGSTYIGTVSSITDDTHLTLNANAVSVVTTSAFNAQVIDANNQIIANTISNFGEGVNNYGILIGIGNSATFIPFQTEGQITIANNFITGNASLSDNFYGIWANGTTGVKGGVSANIYGNSITAASSATTNNVYGMYLDILAPTTVTAANTVNVYSNTIGVSSWATGTSGGFYGIYSVSISPYTAFVGPTKQNIYNNVISAGNVGSSSANDAAAIGIYAINPDTTITGAAQNIYGNTVSNITETNTGNAFAYGIYANNKYTSSTISGNTVHDIYSAGNSTNAAYFGNAVGIYTANGLYNGSSLTSKVDSNKVYTISGTGTTSQAIGIQVNGQYSVAPSVTLNTYYNMIGDITAPNNTAITAPNNSSGFNYSGYTQPPVVIGLAIGSITNGSYTPISNKVYYNTIYLNQANANIGSAAIYAGLNSSSNSVDMRNNIAVNNSSATGTGYATDIYFGYSQLSNSTPGTINKTSNNNLYYAGTASGNNHIYLDLTGAAYQSVSSYASSYSFSGGAGGESASILGSATNPTFLSTTGSSANFLFPDPSVAQSTESNGQIISGYTSAFNCSGCRASYPLGGQVNGGGTAPDIGAVESDVKYLAPPPTISVNTPTAFCTGGSGAALTAGCSANCTGVTYAWAPSTGLSATTGSSVNANPTVTTTYTVTGANSGGSSSTATSVVTVNQAPTVFAVSGSSPCGAVTVQQSGSTAAVSYQLYLNGAITGSPVSGSGNAINFGSQNTGGTYTVIATNAGGCTANMNGSATVSPTPVGGIVTTPYVIICSGNTTTLTVTGSVGSNLQWQISSDNANWSDISGATNTTTYTTDPGNGATNKFYRMLSKSTACWNVASTTAEVDVSNPTITVTAANITDNALTLNWSPTGSGNYLISYSGPTSGTQTSVTPPKTITGLSSDGTYNITVTQTGVSGCSASGTLTGVNTLCAMPTGVTLSSPAPAQIQVSWTGTPGADYRVYYRPLFSYTTYFTKDVSNASSVLLTKQGANNLYASNTYEVYVSRLDCPTTGVVGQGTNPMNVTTLPTVSCATPVIDSVRSLCPVQLEVFIHDNGVNQYNVYIQRITPSILAVNSYGISGTYFTINTPYSGDQYLIAIDAKCGSALSSLYVYPGNVTIKPLCNALTNLVLSNPTCHGFTASWNTDQCESNSASGYDFYLRVAGTINYNSYGVGLPGNGVDPHELLNFLTTGRTYQVFVRSVYNCNGFVTYGPSSQVETITTLSSGCRDEDVEQPQENKPAVQQYSPDNNEVFSLYPNPNSGEFVVDLSRLNTEEDAVRIEVFNMLGQTVLTHLTSISDGHMNEYINMPRGIATGTYIVRLTAGKNIYTAKINISK